MTAFRYYSQQLDGSEADEMVDFSGHPVALPEAFYYMTCHRQENTNTDEKLKNIFDAMEALDAPTVYPVYPRNHERAERLGREQGYQKLILIQPVGYKASISLVNRAKKIVTDSGGLQREAFLRKSPV